MYLPGLMRFMGLQSKCDVDYHHEVEHKADDWRQAQNFLAKNVFELSIVYRGYVLFLTEGAFDTMTDSGRKSEQKATKARVKAARASVQSPARPSTAPA